MNQTRSVYQRTIADVALPWGTAMMRRQETAASISEEVIVLLRPNLPIRYIQLDIPGRDIKPDEQIANIVQTSLRRKNKSLISVYQSCAMILTRYLLTPHMRC
jgi:hypothetical protein